jgi:hypothetical protein
MKTTKEPSPAPPAPASGATKPTKTRKFEAVGDRVRVPNWPAALKDPEVAETVAGMVYESYDIVGESKVATYRPA